MRERNETWILSNMLGVKLNFKFGSYLNSAKHKLVVKIRVFSLIVIHTLQKHWELEVYNQIWIFLLISKWESSTYFVTHVFITQYRRCFVYVNKFNFLYGYVRVNNFFILRRNNCITFGNIMMRRIEITLSEEN